MKKILIHTDFIQIDQALKKESLIQSGGEMAFFIEKKAIRINHVLCTEKRKKVYPGDQIHFQGEDFIIARDNK